MARLLLSFPVVSVFTLFNDCCVLRCESFFRIYHFSYVCGWDDCALCLAAVDALLCRLCHLSLCSCCRVTVIHAVGVYGANTGLLREQVAVSVCGEGKLD